MALTAKLPLIPIEEKREFDGLSLVAKRLLSCPLLIVLACSLSFFCGASIGLPSFSAADGFQLRHGTARALSRPDTFTSFSTWPSLAQPGLTFDNTCVTRKQIANIDALGSFPFAGYLAQFPGGDRHKNPFMASSPYAGEHGRDGISSSALSLSFAQLIQLQKDVVRFVQESTDLTWHAASLEQENAAIDQFFSRDYEAYTLGRSERSADGRQDVLYAHGLPGLKSAVRDKRQSLNDLKIRISNTLFQPVVHPEYGVIATWTAMPDVSSAGKRADQADYISYRGQAITLVIAEDGRWKYRVELPVWHDEGEMFSSTGGAAWTKYLQKQNVDLSGEVNACLAPPAPQNFFPAAGGERHVEPLGRTGQSGEPTRRLGRVR